MRKKQPADEMRETAQMFHAAMDAARKSGKTKVIQCKKCGVDVVVPLKAAVAKYCPKCAEEAAKEARKRSREKRAETRTGICHRCGVEFTFVFVGGQEWALCDDCKNKKGGRPKPLPKKRKKKRGPTLAELERAAREMGMSYGKYKAWLDSQKQKGAKKT
jgi:uncharacterized paraquat-inducible protein A